MTNSWHHERHYIHSHTWLRAGVLGANDGIISLSSFAVGLASAGSPTEIILLATLAALIAGAFSMAAGEYVSVCAQSDSEKADIAREKRELERNPKAEHRELTNIYIQRGLSPDLALQVANELTEKDALGAHMRDELGIRNESTHPLAAAFSSATAFFLGGGISLLVVFVAPREVLLTVLWIVTLLSLAVLGILAAWLGGSSVRRNLPRVLFWGTLAMLATTLVGEWAGVFI